MVERAQRANSLEGGRQSSARSPIATRNGSITDLGLCQQELLLHGLERAKRLLEAGRRRDEPLVPGFEGAPHELDHVRVGFGLLQAGSEIEVLGGQGEWTLVGEGNEARRRRVRVILWRRVRVILWRQR